MVLRIKWLYLINVYYCGQFIPILRGNFVKINIFVNFKI
jgi:hypothetical protein